MNFVSQLLQASERGNYPPSHPQRYPASDGEAYSRCDSLSPGALPSPAGPGAGISASEKRRNSAVGKAASFSGGYLPLPQDEEVGTSRRRDSVSRAASLSAGECYGHVATSGAMVKPGAQTAGLSTRAMGLPAPSLKPPSIQLPRSPSPLAAGGLQLQRHNGLF